MKLGELLKSKDFKYRLLITIDQSETIFEAIRILSEHDRGAITVVDMNRMPVGIITERDIVRKCIARGQDCYSTKVKDIMSKNLVIGTVDDDLSYAINIMKQERIRHLPVMEKENLLGMISMRDLLGVELETCTTQTRFLTDFISGSYG